MMPNSLDRRVYLMGLAAALASVLAGCATRAPAPVPPAGPLGPPPAPPPVVTPPVPPTGATPLPVPGSGSSPVPEPLPSAPPPPPGRAPSVSEELSRLRNELAGTPVVVELTPAGALRVEVPARFCFDAGKAVVRPPLAAVLDRMVTGLRRQTSTQLRVAAPLDPNGGVQLANERAASVCDYLVGHGIAPGRFAAIGYGERQGVELLVSERVS